MTYASAEVVSASDAPESERRGRASAHPGPGKVVARTWTTRRAALITTGANLLIAVIGVCTGIMAARLLGPKGRGELAAIQAWPVALAGVGLLGSSEALVYFCAREREQRSGYLSACFLVGSFGALVCTIAGFIAMPWLLKAQSPSVIWGARLFLTQIWLYLTIVMPVELLRSAGRFFSWNVFRIIPMVLWLAILLAAWASGIRHAVPLAVGTVMLSWIPLAGLIPMVRSEVRRLTIPTRQQLLDVLRFGLPVVGTSVPKLMNFKLDQILMAALMPPIMLGQYVVAVAWSSASAPFVHGLAATLVPDLAGRSDSASQGEAFARVSRISVLIAALLSMALLATAAFGIPLCFGTRFHPAVRTAEILALAGGVAGFNMVLSEGNRGLGRPVSVLRAEILGVIVTVAGLWLFLRPFGLIGAAVVSLVAYTSTTVWLLTEARSATGVSMLEFTIPQWRDVQLLAAHLIAITKTFIGRIRKIDAQAANEA